MAICVETVQKHNPQDVRTPVFIFERLCSIIYPEENDIGEFFLTLEKDPQQEDFLQVSLLMCVCFHTKFFRICIDDIYLSLHFYREECWEILTAAWNPALVHL